MITELKNNFSFKSAIDGNIIEFNKGQKLEIIKTNNETKKYLLILIDGKYKGWTFYTDFENVL